MVSGVVQAKRERRQGLAATGWHRKSEQARGVGGMRPDRSKNLSAQLINLWRPSGIRSTYRCKSGDEIGQDFLEGSPIPVGDPAFNAIVERLSILVVGIYKTGKDHAAESQP